MQLPKRKFLIPWRQKFDTFAFQKSKNLLRQETYYHLCQNTTRPQDCNFIQKETLAQVLFCEQRVK